MNVLNGVVLIVVIFQNYIWTNVLQLFFDIDNIVGWLLQALSIWITYIFKSFKGSLLIKTGELDDEFEFLHFFLLIDHLNFFRYVRNPEKPVYRIGVQPVKTKWLQGKYLSGTQKRKFKFKKDEEPYKLKGSLDNFIKPQLPDSETSHENLNTKSVKVTSKSTTIVIGWNR
ncbi:hypothetical protein QTP88_018901 [Uroleucon formosanum]